MKAPNEEILFYAKTTITLKKNIQLVTTQLLKIRWSKLIFIRLAVVACKICEIPRNSPKIRTYCSPRSSEVINLVANRKGIFIIGLCNFLSVINSNC